MIWTESLIFLSRYSERVRSLVSCGFVFDFHIQAGTVAKSNLPNLDQHCCNNFMHACYVEHSISVENSLQALFFTPKIQKSRVSPI
jgi:hypothetical protein